MAAVPAGSASFDSGTSGNVSVSQVHKDRVPMPPPNGMNPKIVFTIQPEDVRFDPPAPIIYPNVYGYPAGKIVNLYSFDHHLGQWVSIGTGSVTEDGAFIASDPGVGIIHGGWQFPEPPPPPVTAVSNDKDRDDFPDDQDPLPDDPRCTPIATGFPDAAVPMGNQNKWDNLISYVQSEGAQKVFTTEEFKALIAAESTYKPGSESSADAVGLTQITQSALDEIEQVFTIDNPNSSFKPVADALVDGGLGLLKDPERAIWAGNLFVSVLDQRVNNILRKPNLNLTVASQQDFKKLIVATYNAGTGNIDTALDLAKQPENNAFPDGVFTWDKFSKFLITQNKLPAATIEVDKVFNLFLPNQNLFPCNQVPIN